MHKVAIDLDDVVADFNGAFIPYMNAILGTSVTYETHRSFDLCEVYGIPEDQVREHLADFCHHEEHDTIKPIAGSHEALSLLETQYELHLVTNRCQSLVDITCDWLTSYDLNVFTDYHFTNHINLVPQKRQRSKAEVCRKLGVIALFEDALHNANDVAQAGIPVIMPNRPWNEDGITHPNVIRTTNWAVGCEHLQGIAA